MTDSGFHITPVDIRSQQFHRSLRGYAPAGVEEFRERADDVVGVVTWNDILLNGNLPLPLRRRRRASV